MIVRNPKAPMEPRGDRHAAVLTRTALSGCVGCSQKLGKPVRLKPTVGSAVALPACPPLGAFRVDSRSLRAAGVGGRHRFNASLLRYRGRLLLAYRSGWGGAQIHVAELGDDLAVRRNVTLNLSHPRRARYGREDPRLFVHHDCLHVAYTGVEGRNGPTSVLYARLNDDLGVAAVVYPHYPRRQKWEKNWELFSHGGQLYAVYTIRPHRVLRIVNEVPEDFALADWAPRWSGGELRGGASPVLVGDEYWCFFHGARPVGGVRHYNVGVYTFDARPPFRPLRYTPAPLLWAHPPSKPADQYVPVVFPCGAVLENGVWRVSCGIHDRWIEVFDFDHRRVESVMASAGTHTPGMIDGAGGATLRPNTVDRHVWREVYEEDEYGLPADMTGRRVLDIGGHVGSFARLCLDRGAAAVWAVEPDPGNAALLRRNLGGVDPARWRVLEGAAWTAAGTLPLTRDPGFNTGGRCVGEGENPDYETLTVPAFAFDDLIGELSGHGRHPIDIKLDCEGAEWPLLWSSGRLEWVRSIRAEYHLLALGQAQFAVPAPGIQALALHLEFHGFTVSVSPPDDTGNGHFRATREG